MVSPVASRGVVPSRTNAPDVANATTSPSSTTETQAPAAAPSSAGGLQDEFVPAAAPVEGMPDLSAQGAPDASALDEVSGAGAAKKVPAPVQIARAVVDQGPEGEPGPWATDVAESDTPVGKAMTDGVPPNVNCANFVSGVLEVAGWLQPEQHRDNTGLAPGVDDGLYDELSADQDNWEEVDPGKEVGPEDFQPGDVVFLYKDNPDGGPPLVDHVVICTGKDADGNPTFVGANNMDSNYNKYSPDGAQRITEKTYPPELWGQLDQVHIMRHQ